MNTIAHGIDLVECARIERIWRDHGDRFLERIFTPTERRYCLDCKTPVQRLAGRFAAKEAILKTLGTGWRAGIEWTEMEILSDALGRPICTLHGRTSQIAAERGIKTIIVSISHTEAFATGSAIGLG